jgi:hypothetical protein
MLKDLLNTMHMTFLKDVMDYLTYKDILSLKNTSKGIQEQLYECCGGKESFEHIMKVEKNWYEFEKREVYNELSKSMDKNYSLKNVVERMTMYNISPNMTGPYGKTLLMKAIENDDIETVRMLLEHPFIHIDRQDNDGDTALMYTCNTYCRYADIAECILDAGANLYIENNMRWTALDRLREVGEEPIDDMVDLLVRYGADPEEADEVVEEHDRELRYEMDDYYAC